jgi:ADP-ribosyl-[dinitrogen reductase] hydrolase
MGLPGLWDGGAVMIGGIIGDFVGSVYEGYRIKSYNFQNLISHHSRITDDSVQLCGTAEAILTGCDFVSSYRKWGRKYWNAGFSMHTQIWMRSDSLEYKNPNPGVGPATRSGLIGFLEIPQHEICELARESARASHSHEEAIQGAEAVALCIYLIREGFSQQRIKEIMYKKYEYYLEYDYSELNKSWYFDTSAINVVPVAIFIGLYAADFEDLIRTVLYVGGDADSIGCIAGLIGQARFGVCEKLKAGTQKYLFRHANDALLLSQQFEKKYL